MDLITENSLELYKSIHEATTEADIASFEEIINRLTEDKYKSSLAYQICEVQPVTKTNGYIFVARKNAAGDIEIVRELANLELDKGDTGMSAEAFDDINRIFKGKRALTLMKNLLKGESDDLENQKLITFLSAKATDIGNKPISTTTDAELIVFEISQVVAELTIKCNEDDTFNSLSGFAVLPHKVAASFLAMNGIDSQKSDGLFIGQYGKIKYFMNPDKTETKVYTGIVEKNRLGKSSIVFSPYQYILSKSTKYNDGSSNVFMINRYAFTENPLSVNGTKMIYSFTPTFV